MNRHGYKNNLEDLIWKYYSGTTPKRLAMLLIARLSKTYGYCNSAVEHLALRCRVSERAMQYTLKGLIDERSITVLANANGGKPGATRHLCINLERLSTAIKLPQSNANCSTRQKKSRGETHCTQDYIDKESRPSLNSLAKEKQSLEDQTISPLASDRRHGPVQARRQLKPTRVMDLTRGQWPTILQRFGIDGRFLQNRHGPCPICPDGGTDRFRFDDLEGRGTYICNRCGSGDGMNLLMKFNGWSFSEAARQIESHLGAAISDYRPSRPPMASISNEDHALAIWNQSLLPSSDSACSLYLSHRIGVEELPDAIRFNPSLLYSGNKSQRTSHHPAMIAMVSDARGNFVAIHRTYLAPNGRKADVAEPKRLLGKAPAGSAVRLFPARACLGIAEGIETALAAADLFNVPVWAALNANGLATFAPPPEVQSVLIFADNDANNVGQKAARTLATRLEHQGIRVEIRIPVTTDSDWLDVLNSRKSRYAD